MPFTFTFFDKASELEDDDDDGVVSLSHGCFDYHYIPSSSLREKETCLKGLLFIQSIVPSLKLTEIIYIIWSLFDLAIVSLSWSIDYHR